MVPECELLVEVYFILSLSVRMGAKIATLDLLVIGPVRTRTLQKVAQMATNCQFWLH